MLTYLCKRGFVRTLSESEIRKALIGSGKKQRVTNRLDPRYGKPGKSERRFNDVMIRDKARRVAAMGHARYTEHYTDVDTGGDSESYI